MSKENNVWKTKEDVLRDLELLTGGRIDPNDPQIQLVRDRPYRNRQNQEADAEMLRDMYGINPEDGEYVEENTAPDIAGITQMLQMARRDGVLPDYSEPAFQPPRNDGQLEISKLNPSAQVYNPVVSPQNTPSSSKNTNTSNEVTKLGLGKRIDVDKLNPQEAAELAESLKKKIILTPNPKTIQEKTEKNCAITSIIRLNAKKNQQVNPQPGVTESIKKVENWFKEPEEKKKVVTPAKPHLGPVVFARKVKKPSQEATPTPSTSSEQSASTSGKYVPTQRALEMGKKFTEHYEMNRHVQETLFESVSRKLQEKEALQKKKKESENAESSNEQ